MKLKMNGRTFVCAICHGTYHNLNDVETEKCCQSYPHIILDETEGIFYPQGDGYIYLSGESGKLYRYKFPIHEKTTAKMARNSVTKKNDVDAIINLVDEPNDENVNSKNTSNLSAMKSTVDVEDVDILIREVAKRPILVNRPATYVPYLAKRKLEEWESICKILNNKYSPETLQKKWESLNKPMKSYSRIVLSQGTVKEITRTQVMNSEVEVTERVLKKPKLETPVVPVIKQEKKTTQETEKDHANSSVADIDGLFSIIRPALERINPYDRFAVNLEIMNVINKAKQKLI